MLVEINIFLAAFALISMLVSWLLAFFKKNESFPLLAWFAFILLAVSALTNISQGKTFCDFIVTNSTSGDGVWKCNLYNIETYPLTYLFGALAVVQLIFAFVVTFWKTFESL